jgi:hypothetical protein
LSMALCRLPNRLCTTLHRIGASGYMRLGRVQCDRNKRALPFLIYTDRLFFITP